jgi:hypothetical protein
MGETNLPGELETKANGRRGQRAGMLSRSWLRFVVMMTLNIATEPARVNAPQVRPAHLGLILSHESGPGPKPKWLNVRFCAAVGGQADIKRASPGFLTTRNTAKKKSRVTVSQQPEPAQLPPHVLGHGVGAGRRAVEIARGVAEGQDWIFMRSQPQQRILASETRGKAILGVI